jgi:4,5-dihydroxyphthalate decarboxylase
MRLATHRFDRTAALVDGTIRLKDVAVIKVPSGPTAVKGLFEGIFDAAEIPLSRYVFWVTQEKPFVAIPVFTDRLFSYPYVYTRADSGISSLRDLRGRRVVIAPRYFTTPGFWHRAILKEEYGILPEEIEWCTMSPEGEESLRIPSNLKLTVTPGSIHGLERLLDGTGECLMAARTPPLQGNEQHRIRRVYSNAHALQREWYERSGSFPILHVVVMRKDALRKRPTFGEELCRAYDLAKDRAYRILQDERMTSLPFMREILDETVARCGDDPWPYGLERNRSVLDYSLEQMYDQGLTTCRLSVEELFDERASRYKFVSRMVPGSIIGIADGGWAESSINPDESFGQEDQENRSSVSK